MFFGFAGLAYASSARPFLRYLGEHGLSMAGGICLAIGFTNIIMLPLTLIPIGMFTLGLGLNMLHNTLQTNATQMAPKARGLAVSTFANSLFLGQAAGIFAGGFVVDNIGFPITYAISALGLVFLGGAFAYLLTENDKSWLEPFDKSAAAHNDAIFPQTFPDFLKFTYLNL